MVPYELTLHNFMCYRENLPPLRLDGLHIACLSGHNGAGKSALLDAITWALWGKARMSDDDLIAQGASEMLVDMSFAIKDQCYRVIRRRQRGKTGKSGKTSSGRTALDFQMQGVQGWHSLSETTATETQEVINRVLRMQYETFINASFLLQNRADEFTRKTPGERKKVLAEILDLGEYQMLSEKARDRADDLRTRITTLDGRIAQLAQEAARLDLFAQYVAEAETRVASLSEQLTAAEETHQQAVEQVRQLEEQQQQRTDIQTRLVGLRDEQRQMQQEIASVRQQIAADEVVVQRRAEIIAGVEELAAAQHDQARLEALRPRYDALCEERRQHQATLKEQLQQLQFTLKEQQREVKRLREQAEQRSTILSALDDLTRQLADFEPVLQQVEEARRQRSDLAERLNQVHGLLVHYVELTGTITQQQQALQAQRDEQQRTIQWLEGQLRDMPQVQADLDAAKTQQQRVDDLQAQLAELRKTDQATAEHVGALRAGCEQLHQQANNIKQRKNMLSDETARTCPLCHSDLGEHGIANIHAHYDQEITHLRERYRIARDDANTQEEELEQLREQIGTAEKELAQAQQQAARVPPLQRQLAQATAWQRDLDQARSASADIEQRLASGDYALDARAALQAIDADLADLTGTVPPTDAPPDGAYWSAAAQTMEKERKSLERRQGILEQQLATRPDIESQTAIRRRELEAVEQATADLPQAEKQAAALADTIERGDFAHEIRQAGRDVEAQLAELGYTPDAAAAAREAVQQLAHWSAEEQRLQMADSQLENNRRLLQRYVELDERQATEITHLEQQEQQLTRQLHALPDARRQAETARQTADESRRSLEAARRDLYEKQSMHNRAQQASEQLATVQAERDTLSERRSLFEELTDAFGKKGVQAMLIETAIPEIEREANRLLSRITGNQMHVTFEMQRNTKKGDIQETLEIKIADALGTRTYDAFSGGEAMRINFAIRLALSRLLAGRAGASLETLVIDEGMGALDADGRERFVEAITSIQHDFKRILVITHLDDLKDRFPVRIEITKEPHSSLWMLL